MPVAGFDGSDEMFDCIVPAGIAEILDPLVDPCGPVVVLGEPVFDYLMKGCQD